MEKMPIAAEMAGQDVDERDRGPLGNNLGGSDIDESDVEKQARVQHQLARRPIPRRALTPGRPAEKSHQERGVHRREHRHQPQRAPSR